jgi:hypothetical protein
MLDRLTKSKGGRMEIHFEAGLKRPRDATESAKLVSEAAVAVRCHARILPTWIQYRNDKYETQFNTFLKFICKYGYVWKLVISSWSVPYFLGCW